MTSTFDAFQREWATRLGDCPPPTFSPSPAGDFRVDIRNAQVHDAAVIDIRAVSATRTEGTPAGDEDQVRLYALSRGALTLAGPPADDERTITAGQFLLRYDARPPHYQTAPRSTMKMIVLPGDLLKPLLLAAAVTGPTDSPEVRLLTAHANMIRATAPGLGPAGLQAARSTLIELAKGVARGGFDDTERQLAPALARAARDLADSVLADPGLSAATLARELNVSVRTLQRAFATAGETAAGYIRRRRLEEARLALISSPARLTVTELAAYWQFADSSHFIRAFKKCYGQTPAEYAQKHASVPRRGSAS